MGGQAHTLDWEYCHVGPADSFQGLVGELKAKTRQGWEVAGIRSDASKVYATVKRPVQGMAVEEQRVA